MHTHEIHSPFVNRLMQIAATCGNGDTDIIITILILMVDPGFTTPFVNICMNMRKIIKKENQGLKINCILMIFLYIFYIVSTKDSGKIFRYLLPLLYF